MKTQCKLLGILLLNLGFTAYCPAAASDGWTDLKQFLVESDGSRSLGDTRASFNDTRDQGSKILFFDSENGNNAQAEVYWWDGSHIVDSTGSRVDSEGREYGTDPLELNEEAVKVFQYPIGMRGNIGEHDPRLRTHSRIGAANGYADWFLLRRGQKHEIFDAGFKGGRSEEEPLVIAAYGPKQDGRAIVDPDTDGECSYEGTMRGIVEPLGDGSGGDSASWFHKVISGLEMHDDLSFNGLHLNVSLGGGVPTLLMEDCRIINGGLAYLPRKTTVRRCVSGYHYDPDSHNQGYFTYGHKMAVRFEESIFYKNGYKTNPLTDPDPKRTIFDRNFYQSGSAQLGTVYHNVISADGGSGGPQMRGGGGVCEQSLIVEGYYYSSLRGEAIDTWFGGAPRRGRSTIVRDNVQLIYKYPTVNDPDTEDKSDNRAQPGNGYHFGGATFGGIAENNIATLAMLVDDLGQPDASSATGFSFSPVRAEYENTFYVQKNDTIRGNITYRTKYGLGVSGDWTDVTGHVAENNIFVSDNPIRTKGDKLLGATQLDVRNNRFYTNESLSDEPWIGEGNIVSPYEQAAPAEGWPDPDRTLKRYVKEVTNLTLLDWEDDPNLDPEPVAVRVAAGEEYDPAGLKTFMAVATNMRNGGTMQAPSSGKPSWTGDYAWDERFTAVAVVNWIREGFGMDPVESMNSEKPRNVNPKPASLFQSRPNGSGGYRISFGARPGDRVTVTIRDFIGRSVQSLGVTASGAKRNIVTWNGRSRNGSFLSRGTYLVTLTVNGNFQAVRKLLHNN